MKCPHCKKNIDKKIIAAFLGARGGSVRGKTKIRGNSEYYSRIAKMRKKHSSTTPPLPR